MSGSEGKDRNPRPRARSRRAVGRRPLFFAVLGLVSLALLLPTPAEFRWVVWMSVGLSFFWAVMLALDEVLAPQPPSSGRAARGVQASRVPPVAAPPNPFEPPPSPGERS